MKSGENLEKENVRTNVDKNKAKEKICSKLSALQYFDVSVAWSPTISLMQPFSVIHQIIIIVLSLKLHRA